MEQMTALQVALGFGLLTSLLKPAALVACWILALVVWTPRACPAGAVSAMS